MFVQHIYRPKFRYEIDIWMSNSPEKRVSKFISIPDTGLENYKMYRLFETTFIISSTLFSYCFKKLPIKSSKI